MSEPKLRRVWPIEEAGPIRGQQSSMFFDSTGSKAVKAVWHEERTYRAFCGKCRYLLRFKGLTQYLCPKCDTLNDVT